MDLFLRVESDEHVLHPQKAATMRRTEVQITAKWYASQHIAINKSSFFVAVFLSWRQHCHNPLVDVFFIVGVAYIYNAHSSKEGCLCLGHSTRVLLAMNPHFSGNYLLFTKSTHLSTCTSIQRDLVSRIMLRQPATIQKHVRMDATCRVGPRNRNIESGPQDGCR